MIIEIDKISLLDTFNQIQKVEVLGDQVFVFDTFECFCQIKNNEIGSLLLVLLDKMLPIYTTKHRVSIVKDTIVWEGVRSWKLEWEH